MKIPDLVVKYICRDTIQARNVAFIEVDKQGGFRASGGAIGHYVSAALEPGVEVGEKVGFLAGMFPLEEEPLLLVAIEVNDGVYADAHLVPGEESDWILLFDTSERSALDQLLQQRSYEVHLLREKLDRNLRERDGDTKESLDLERRKSRHLLLSLLPGPIVDRVNRGEKEIVDEIEEAALVEIAVDDFPGVALRLEPGERARLLGEVFAVIEDVSQAHGGTFLKTLGPACLVGLGLHGQKDDPVRAAAELALNLRHRFAEVTVGESATPVRLRFAVSAGPVNAGIVGFQRFGYEVWGPAVGEAGWLVRLAEGGQILVAANLESRLREGFELKDVGRPEAIELSAAR
jgi:class 3 adenylate cyclase